MDAKFKALIKPETPDGKFSLGNAACSMRRSQTALQVTATTSFGVEMSLSVRDILTLCIKEAERDGYNTPDDDYPAQRGDKP